MVDFVQRTPFLVVASRVLQSCVDLTDNIIQELKVPVLILISLAINFMGFN